MIETQWRDRLQVACEKSGKSMRSLSLSSGNGPGYLHSVLTEGKDPTLKNFISLCMTIDVSIIYILHGYDITPDEMKLLKVLKHDPVKTAALMTLLSN